MRALQRRRSEARRSAAAIGAARAIGTKANVARTRITIGAAAAIAIAMTTTAVTGTDPQSTTTVVTSTRPAPAAAGTRTTVVRTSTNRAQVAITSGITRVRIGGIDDLRRAIAREGPVWNVEAGDVRRGASLRRCLRPSLTICRILRGWDCFRRRCR